MEIQTVEEKFSEQRWKMIPYGPYVIPFGPYVIPSGPYIVSIRPSVFPLAISGKRGKNKPTRKKLEKTGKMYVTKETSQWKTNVILRTCRFY